ncbi:MAG: hypothetical protein KC478_05260 [Bacteriovoracaceae bacterium]|nr:hypothetical protein [Bacteriovoracaceae bacterium]
MKALTLLLTFSLNLAYGWSPETLKEFNSLQGAAKYEQSDFMTLWGALKRSFGADDLKGEEFKIKHPMLEDELKVYSYKNKKKAPLVIFFPGIFGSHEGEISAYITNIFESRDFHVGVVPNFLNKNYIKSRPKYSDSNAIDLDVHVSLAASENIVDRIGQDNIESITFIGESLGTYVASSSIQFRKLYPKLFGALSKVILLWPPLDVKKSLEGFNQKFKTSKSTYESCYMFLKIPSFIKHYVWQDLPQNVSKDDARCFGAYLFQKGFLVGMLKSYETSSELKGVERESEPTNFGEFVEFHNPHYFAAMEKEPHKLQLKNWVKKWRASGIELNIVSSKDDFINEPQGWSSIEDAYLLDWGGHCAPLSLDVWQNILAREAR